MKRLIRIFNIIVLIIPLTMGLCFAIVYFTGGWERWLPEHTLEFYSEKPLTGRFAAVMFYLVLIALAAGIKVLINRYSRHREIVELCLIVMIALALRLMVVVPDTLFPFSDFYRVWEMVHGNMEGHIEYYTLFPTYLNFTVFLRDYLSIVGDVFVNTLYLNVALSTGTVVIIYLIAREVVENSTVPFIAALLYTLMPANILYCSAMTPEFITIFFDSLGVLLLLRVSKREWDAKNAGLMFAAGISIGIGSAYKSFGIIILVGAGMCLAARKIIDKAGWKRILLGIAAVAIVFSGYKVTKSLLQMHTEKVLGIELDESRSLPHFLLIGLNTEGEGQIHLGTMSRSYYKTYLENGMDAQAAKAAAYDLLKTDWIAHKEKIPELLRDKLIWAWQDDASPMRFYNIALKRDNQDIKWMGLSVATLTQIFYMIVLFGAVVGCLLSWREVNLKKEFLLLIIFGYLCIVLLSEAQSRYKCLIMPFLCVISAMGAEIIIKKMRCHHILKVRKSSKKEQL